MPITKATIELFLRNRNPFNKSRAALVPRVRGMGGTLRVDSTIAIVMKPIPATKNAAAVPAVAIITPAMAGAMMRLPCQSEESSATALTRAFLSTR